MRKQAAIFVVVATILTGTFAVNSLQAQAVVAIVDINKVFEQHSVFESQLGQLQTEAESLQGRVAKQRQQLAASAEQLELMYRVGTAEYSEKEKSLAMESAKIELEARDQMRELMRREARLHYDVYYEIRKIVAAYCQETGTQMVLRYSGVKADANDPDSIMQQVNAAVVWHRADRDVTELVLQRLGRTQPAVSQVPPNSSNR